MKLFIDSANLEEIEKAYATGVIDGITTNPSLLKKALSDLKKGKKKFSIEEYVTDILIIAKNTPVSLEVNSTDHDAIVKEATALYNRFNPISNNVYIKVPINTSLTGKTKQTEAIRAIKTLTQARIPVNATLVFTPEQALLAAKAGARQWNSLRSRLCKASSFNNQAAQSPFNDSRGINPQHASTPRSRVSRCAHRNSSLRCNNVLVKSSKNPRRHQNFLRR